MRFQTALLPLTMPLVLAACLGGGGGGSGSSSGGQSGPLTLNSTPTAFTSFSDIEANSLVEATAGSALNYRAGVIDENVQRDGTITTTGTSALRLLTGDVIDPDDPDAGLEFGGLRLTVNLEDDATIVHDFVEDPTEVGTGATADRFGKVEIENADNAVTDRLHLETGPLNYMTFGLWELGIGEASIDIGGAAWGVVTPLDGVGGMPIAGTATYQGDLIGYNVLAASTTVYVAQSNIDANFGTNTVTFSSSQTRDLETGVADTNFNIIATEGTITGNTFRGSGLDLAASQFGPDFAGEFGGAFYGDEAAEAGGWFEIRNVDNNDRYFGSFGGAQVP